MRLTLQRTALQRGLHRSSIAAKRHRTAMNAPQPAAPSEGEFTLRLLRSAGERNAAAATTALQEWWLQHGLPPVSAYHIAVQAAMRAGDGECARRVAGEADKFHAARDADAAVAVLKACRDGGELDITTRLLASMQETGEAPASVRAAAVAALDALLSLMRTLGRPLSVLWQWVLMPLAGQGSCSAPPVCSLRCAAGLCPQRRSSAPRLRMRCWGCLLP